MHPAASVGLFRIVSCSLSLVTTSREDIFLLIEGGHCTLVFRKPSDPASIPHYMTAEVDATAAKAEY